MPGGARMLAECLAREGVDCMFGYPGGVTLPFYDVLYDHQIRHVLVRHEENAAFAAEGYARATGKAGVCMSTSGPGATNLVTAIADAFMDSCPLVAITGQVTQAMIGRGGVMHSVVFGSTAPGTSGRPRTGVFLHGATMACSVGDLLMSGKLTPCIASR